MTPKSTLQLETRMETIALFEEKIPITPRDLSRGSVNIDNILSEKLSQKLESRCSLHGFVIPGTIKLLSRSMGYIEKGRNTGDVVYHIQAEGNVIYPPDGTILQGTILRKNKMGIFVNYRDAIHIILPRDLHIGNEEFDSLQPDEVVKVEIKKSRFQVNDEYILSVGVYLGKMATATIKITEIAETEQDNEEDLEEEEKE